ncbi:MAG: hypothetical protein IKT37_04995 [Clostridia bacterium]|nr:hypothetical protein [Clostridia bacterium]
MAYIEGASPFLLFLSCALIHEIGHFIAIKAVNGKIGRVDIMPLGARIITVGITSHINDVNVYLSGPLANILFFVLSFPAGVAANSPYVLYFSLCNLFLAFVNLLPISGNDGYCAVIALVSQKAQEEKLFSVMEKTRKISEAVFVLLSFLAVLASRFNPGVIGLTAAANIYKKD